MAPKLIRLALTPNRFMSPNANNIAKGIADATISPARRLPRKSTNTKITINAPSIKFFSTVPIALLTNSVLSKYGSIKISSGSECWMIGIFALIRLTTSLLFSPFNIITTPPTASTLPLKVSAPYRVAYPKPTSAISFIKTGTLPLVFTAILLISSIEVTKPIPLMK